MLSNVLSTSALLLLASKLVSAQTSSACNPVKGDKCPDNEAFPESLTIDFTKGANDYFTIAAGTTLEYDKDMGAVFTISKESDAPTITSTKYIFFGTVEAVIQVAPGTGIVSSFVLESDDLDEVDWEWLGGDTAQAQTNYFSKGNDTVFDRGGFSKVSNPQTGFHTYTVDWSPTAIVWSIDGAVTRTLTSASANNGATFPQTPMQIKLGTWDGGASTQPKGTITWAGGLTPFDDNNGPYKAYYKSIKITNNSNGVKDASSYTYEGTTGTYENIKVNTGGSTAASSSSSSSSSSASSSSSSSSSASSSGSAKGSSATKDSSSATKDTTETSATGKTTATATGSSKSTSTLVTATTTGKSSTATGTSASSSASGTSSTVTTSAGGKASMSIFGAVSALLAAVALL
ncbi:extracellular cell wall glucanase [Grosmannia clavigera kw1407]|uniref:Crh-like protein n=1 Tax=Grosmannia clavigera (strain kw1407 / UAMH 11150) TaxID=655863 RepID=F0XMM3_GROCL|nr:extracellular cell wall glucanase [Grosmannia clavigera kw1407]EFX01447.1 extracellular cell wall glucanase [Grosmannia clavigera kw1407]